MGDQNALHDGDEDAEPGADVEAGDERVHGETDADERESYTCGVCGETFDSPEELHKHLYRVGLVE